MDSVRAAIAEHVELAARLDQLVPQVEQVVAAMIQSFERGGRVYTFGNGGSAAESLHFAEELVARFKRERRPLPAQSLAADPTTLTCIGNDYEFDDIFARQVRAFVRGEDVVVGFTTSGTSRNVVAALAEARKLGATTVLFGGGAGAPATEYADLALVVASHDTARVQEMHVLLLHVLLDEIDRWAAA
jgi:D-sedoheptulose 7-phosphate isomerase